MGITKHILKMVKYILMAIMRIQIELAPGSTMMNLAILNLQKVTELIKNIILTVRLRLKEENA